MTDKTNEVPTQRGTSSGEIGQNPVETIGKQPPKEKSADDPKAKEEKAADGSSSQG